MDNRKNLPCASCGELMWRGRNSLPEGLATCRTCRRLKPRARGVQTPCTKCGGPSWGEQCWPCRYNGGLSQRDAEKRRLLYLRRAERERQAPGLTRTQRSALLEKWKRQGRPCAYCLNKPATSVDHVIPLALGGTNLEGNLTPACALCNSKKNDSLLIEWKCKRRLRRERVRVDVSLQPRKPVDYTKRVCKVYFRECAVCNTPFAGRVLTARYCPAHTGNQRRTPLIGTCVVCQAELQHSATRPRSFCSDVCRKQSPARLAYRQSDAFKTAKREQKKRYYKTPQGREARRRYKKRNQARRRVGAQVETLF